MLENPSGNLGKGSIHVKVVQAKLLKIRLETRRNLASVSSILSAANSGYYAIYNTDLVLQSLEVIQRSDRFTLALFIPSARPAPTQG
jgi:hypothetical protein